MCRSNNEFNLPSLAIKEKRDVENEKNVKSMT